MNTLKIVAILLALTTQISALPDMRNYPHQEVQAEGMKTYITKLENMIHLKKYTNKELGEFFYGYDHITKNRIWIMQKNDGEHLCCVESSIGKKVFSSFCVEGISEGLPSYSFGFDENVRFIVSQLDEKMCGLFQSYY